jgi:flagellar basal-body rod protein FlgB
MSSLIGGIFNLSDKLQFENLNQRLERNHVINANIANAETPGYRAIGYDFEDQLQAVSDVNQEGSQMKVSDPRHLIHSFASADGTIRPDVYVRPTETVGEDGNTVDIDFEMGDLAKNEILYRSAVETINRKIGILRYAINGGR